MKEMERPNKEMVRLVNFVVYSNSARVLESQGGSCFWRGKDEEMDGMQGRIRRIPGVSSKNMARVSVRAKKTRIVEGPNQSRVEYILDGNGRRRATVHISLCATTLVTWNSMTATLYLRSVRKRAVASADGKWLGVVASGG